MLGVHGDNAKRAARLLVDQLSSADALESLARGKAKGIDVVAVISTPSAAALKLKVGKKAHALVKASSVLVATE